MSGYYVQTDILKMTPGGEHVWITLEEEASALASKDTPFGILITGGERFYWNGTTKTMDGAVERAMVYPTTEEAESEAFLAACLDPNLAGHVHVVQREHALALEKNRIEARRREEEKAKFHAQNRFKLGAKDGGI